MTGSFKARGALNKILSLQDWELERGLVTASAGNHGQGVALAANMKHARAIIFASEHALQNKLQAMRDLGAEIQLVPGGYGEAEQAGISYANATGATWVSPYNDGMIIAGQGTIALEVMKEMPNPSLDLLDHSRRGRWSCFRDWVRASGTEPLTEVGRGSIRSFFFSVSNLPSWHSKRCGRAAQPCRRLSRPCGRRFGHHPDRQELRDRFYPGHRD